LSLTRRWLKDIPGTQQLDHMVISEPDLPARHSIEDQEADRSRPPVARGGHINQTSRHPHQPRTAGRASLLKVGVAELSAQVRIELKQTRQLIILLPLHTRRL
jgi:hypothetical protein